MNGPTTLKTCNGCEFLIRKKDNYTSSSDYDCGHPNVTIGSGIDWFITGKDLVIVICPRICPLYNNR
jgi:hypothetical protein